MRKIVITSALRTAVGSLNNALKNISADELGSLTMKEIMSNSKLHENDVDEVISDNIR